MSDYFDSFRFTHEGREFLACLYADDSSDAPWERSDCHGPVSDWETRDKKPGELILSSDRRAKRFYDFAEAMRIAKRDGWGTADGRRDNETPGGYRRRAVMADFEFLRSWCADDWHYCGVAVRPIDDDGEPEGHEYAHALWGIESNAGEYLREVAAELAGECVREIQRKTYPVSAMGV